jgi:hypothetical protein
MYGTHKISSVLQPNDFRAYSHRPLMWSFRATQILVLSDYYRTGFCPHNRFWFFVCTTLRPVHAHTSCIISGQHCTVGTLSYGLATFCYLVQFWYARLVIPHAHNHNHVHCTASPESTFVLLSRLHLCSQTPYYNGLRDTETRKEVWTIPCADADQMLSPVAIATPI